MEQQSAMPPSFQRSFLAAGGLVGIALVAFAAIHLAAPPMPERMLDLSRAKLSEKGLYRVAIEPENGPVRQGELHSWLLQLGSAAGQPVDDAVVTIGGGMPDHGHGLPTRPAVSGQIGAGRYRVDGLKFTMSGWWQLRFSISAEAGSDSAVFNVKL
jgi:YtkA-like